MNEGAAGAIGVMEPYLINSVQAALPLKVFGDNLICPAVIDCGDADLLLYYLPHCPYGPVTVDWSTGVVAER